MDERLSLSQKIIQLRLKTRLATMCEGALGKKKNTLSLEGKVLFLLFEGDKAAVDIEMTLSLSKANLVLLTNRLCREGLLIKYHLPSDARRIMLKITDKGLNNLYARLDIIEERCKKAFDDDEYSDAVNKLDEALRILDFIE